MICEDRCVQLTLYLDAELDVRERSDVDAHLASCADCRRKVHSAVRFRNALKRSAPLYVAPNSLRSRIKSIVDAAALNARIKAPRRPARLPSRRLAWAMGLMLALSVSMVLYSFKADRSVAFAATAVDIHQRHVFGRLPLELKSDSPNRISRWFEDKVSFGFELPNYHGSEKLFSIRGARLVGYNNEYAAYVAYRMGDEPISLVVTSSDAAKPEGGERITSNGLFFHYENIEGFKVITWSHRGLTYALVSNLDERGQQSCLVCHQGSHEQKFIGRLNPMNLGGNQ